MNLAARKSAKPALVDRVLAYLEAGEKAAPEETRWKVLQYQLLVALDRPKDLAKRLQTWIAAGDADNGWRLILGYLEAESGQIPEAIRLFEAVREADELRGGDYRTLADWYMAVNRRDAYDRARVETYKVIEEWRLNNWLCVEAAAVAAILRQSTATAAAARVGRGSDLRLHRLVREGQPAAELSVSTQPVLRRHARLPPAGRTGATRSSATRPGRSIRSCRACPAYWARSATRPRPMRSSQRIAAVRPRAKTEVDRRALDLLGTARRAPRRGVAEPARSARPAGSGGHAAGMEAGLVARRAAADCRLAGIAGTYRPTAAGR